MIINEKQRKVVIVGIVLFILMGLFPPWTYTLSAHSIKREKPAGYALIISSPEPEKNSMVFGVKIDVPRLIIQWIVLVATTSFGVLIANQRNQFKDSKTNAPENVDITKTKSTAPSTELVEWLKGRENAFKLRAAMKASGGRVMLKSTAIDPEELPEPLRTEAIEYLQNKGG